MFLSVIVSCHNCKPYIKRLLNSIIVLDINLDDLEVILSDDNSTDDFLEEVKRYVPVMTIKYFPTEKHKYHCPGNTRMDGWKHASGDWITFIDHDDEFLPGAFKTVQDLLAANSQYDIPFVFSPVLRIDRDGNAALLDATTWLHGNFYKRSFLIENDIDFKEDLFGNEDLYFNNLVNATIAGQGLSMLKLSNPLYKWYYNEKSLSNTRAEDLDYTEKYFGDYLIANSEPHIIGYNKYPEKQDHFKNELTQMILYSYFYYQRAVYNNGEKKVKKMLSDIKKTYKKVLCVLNITTQLLLDEFYKNVDRYNASRNVITALSGSFIEFQSLTQYLKSL